MIEPKDRDTRFVFNQRVRVTRGFYREYIGRCNSVDGEYYSIVIGDDRVWVHEDNLEPAEERQVL